MHEKGLELKDTIIIFDRDLGPSIFQNFRGYDDLADDAEWLLERFPQKSKGFVIRPLSRDGQHGLWLGEYDYNGNQISRQETLWDSNASLLSRRISDYASRRVAEKEIAKSVAIDRLKKTMKSKIILGFKYYLCPIDRSYYTCPHIQQIYDELTRKYGKNVKVPYALVAKEIETTKPCDEVIVCPLVVPNSFERILNLNKALKSRKLGEIRIISSDTVEIV